MPPLVKKKPAFDLAVVTPQTTSVLGQLTQALGVSREVLASDEEIEHAVNELPRLLERIPAHMRSVLHVRMVVAVVNGLFDAAVNYAWNSAMIELRNRVRAFGIHVVPQITGKDFNDDALNDMKDADLLAICLSLNLMGEDAFFYLDQCREVRNSFSAAHPPIGDIDDQEFLTFLNRCAKFALNDANNPKGVDTAAFLKALKVCKFSQLQAGEWIRRLSATHEAQRNLLIGTLHGVYCDPAASEETRVNALNLCKHFAQQFSPKLCSDLINRHSNYMAEDKADRQEASRVFFRQLGLFGLLSESERHTIISTACSRMMEVHLEWNNFYNEHPFAARLRELSSQGAMPESVQPEFVLTVLSCGIGNDYGVCRAALPHYEAMVRNFSPREVAIMFDLAQNHANRLGRRVEGNATCRQRFCHLARLIDQATVPPQAMAKYRRWLA